jgi:hypothetical protein
VDEEMWRLWKLGNADFSDACLPLVERDLKRDAMQLGLGVGRGE